MITGFNTDVDHQGRVFHVQTEDKGLGNPQVESLIYCGGEIICSRRTSYADLAASGNYSEDEVLHRMEAQHQALIRDVFNGKFDTEQPKPFGHNILSNRSLDEVVIDYLLQDVEMEPIDLALLEHSILMEGSRPTLRMQVVSQSAGDPCPCAKVSVTLLSTAAEPREVFSGSTNSDGLIEASFEIPEMADADAAIVCRAELGQERAEFRQMVEKSPPQV
jgi:hypothetical protein